jgi:hypothetical protein
VSSAAQFVLKLIVTATIAAALTAAMRPVQAVPTADTPPDTAEIFTY